MKKILFVAILAMASVMAYAQPRAIGVRLGEFDGVSYQHGIGDSNMLEIEAGFNLGNWYGNRMVGWESGNRWELYGHNVQLAATYDWIDPFGKTFPWEHKGEWNLYPVVGIGGGFYNFWGPIGFVGVAARFGAEYNFWFPLQLSLDYRPIIGVAFPGGAVFNTPGLWNGGIAAGVRYKF